MKRGYSLLLVISCCTYFSRTESFLFQRFEPFPKQDLYRESQKEIDSENMIKLMNMKSYIRFNLWTRKNPKRVQEIFIDDSKSFTNSNYDTGRLTKIIVHGWEHSINKNSMKKLILALRDAYLQLADLNIIVVDYTIYALPIMYLSGAPQIAAKMLSDFIEFLVRNGVDYDHIHLLGYSWGANVAGMAGNKLNGSLSRITGLDPLDSALSLVDDLHRLNKSGAQFVDIIQGRQPLGLEYSLGHANFYPIQPSCAFYQRTGLNEGRECNYGKAVWYFLESITFPYAFPSCKCESWISYVKGLCPCASSGETTPMGEFSPHSTRGVYFLLTRRESPFGLGPQLMNVTLQSRGEYYPELNKHEAKEYLDKIVQKSIKRTHSFLPFQSASLKNNSK